MLTIIPANVDNLETHLQVLVDTYNAHNTEPMNALEYAFFHKRMQLAQALGKAYESGNSFIYLTTERDGWAIVAASFTEDAVSDAYFISEIMIADLILAYIPLGSWFGDMLPFLNKVSLVKFARGAVRNINVIKVEYFENLINYLDKRYG